MFSDVGAEPQKLYVLATVGNRENYLRLQKNIDLKKDPKAEMLFFGPVGGDGPAWLKRADYG